MQDQLSLKLKNEPVKKKDSLRSTEPEMATVAIVVPRQEAKPAPKTSTLGDKACPKCSSSMIRRTAKKGKYAGSTFLACSAYPTCKIIIPLDSV
ncbi:MAG: hypothetical protein AUK35_10060 [Zetaproteobacteria bacterium CG2_30_46_52]|nr:MAG: hypothetical protein AUK35_10060 [Zetaproteobacteria bacterium CG2_30_46_52]